MTPELFLHIGTTKTGSTSIQHSFEAHRRALREQGAYWPVTSGGTKRHQLLAASHATPKKRRLRGTASFLQGMEPAARMAAYREEFVREIGRLPKRIDRVIMSAEQFSIALRTQTDIAGLRDYLAPLFSKVTIIVYLRRQDSHFSSLFAQHLRVGNVSAPDLSRVKIDGLHDYDYYDLVMRWATVFGEDNIKPRIFERSGTSRFDVVEDFCSLCRVALDIDPQAGITARNPSMTLVGQEILLKADTLLEKNTAAKASSLLWNRLAESVTRVLPGDGWKPTQEEARSFLARFEASNEALRVRWFPERARLFSDDFSALPVSRQAVDPAVAFDAACAVLLDAIAACVAREQAMSQEIVKLADEKGDTKRSIAQLMRLMFADRGNIGIRMQIAEQHIKLGDTVAAAATFKAARRLSPEDPLLAPMAEKLAALGVTITAESEPDVRPRKPRRRIKALRADSKL